jgi:hypothetical protein
LAAQSRRKLSFPRLWCITLPLDIDAPFWRLKIFESRAEHDSQRGPIRPILREHDEPKGVDMKQDEQKLVDMVLSEIQSILAELPPNDASVVVSGFNGLNAKPTVETAHHVKSEQNEPKTSDAIFTQEIEALLGISPDRSSCQTKSPSPDRGDSDSGSSSGGGNSLAQKKLPPP